MATTPEETKKTLVERLEDYKPLHYEPMSLPRASDYATYPGRLRLSRIMQGKPDCFAISSTSVKNEKKIIIVTDYSLTQPCGNDKKERSVNFLSALSKAGYSVCYWNGEAVVPMLTGSSALQCAIKASSDEKLKKYCNEYNIPWDKIYHLHDLMFQALLCEKELGFNSGKPPTLFAANFSHLEKIPEEVQEWLKERKFFLEMGHIFLKSSYRGYHPKDKEEQTVLLCQKAFEHFCFLLDTYPQNIIGLNVEASHPVSTIYNLKEIIFQRIATLKNLTSFVFKEYDPYFNPNSKVLSNIRFMKGGFHSLRKIEIVSADKHVIEEVSCLIARSPLLEKIDVNGWNYSEKLLLKFPSQGEWQYFGAHHLTELKLASLSFNMSDFFQFIEKFVSLKKIDLTSCYVECNESEFCNAANSLQEYPALEEVTISRTPHIVFLLLIKNPHIRKLRISGERIAHVLFKQIDNSTRLFPRLTDLALYDCTIDPEDLGNTLIHSNDLESLTLQGAMSDVVIQPEYQETFLLENLRDLQLYDKYGEGLNLYIPLKTYLFLVSRAPRIKTIEIEGKGYQYGGDNITYCNLREEGGIEDPNLSLDHVMTLKLAATTVSGEALGYILNRACNLRTIDIAHCKNIATLLPEALADNLIFSELTTITCTGSEIRGDTLAFIMSRAPKLDGVEATRCSQMSSYHYSTLNCKPNLPFTLKIDNNISLRERLYYDSQVRRLTTLNLHVLSDYGDDVLVLNDDIDLPWENIDHLVLGNNRVIGAVLKTVLMRANDLRRISGLGVHAGAHEMTTDEVLATSITEAHLPENLWLPNLRTLDLSGININTEAFTKLCCASERLFKINIDYCTMLSDLSYEALPIARLKTLDEFSFTHSSIPIGTAIAIELQLSKLGMPTKKMKIDSFNSSFQKESFHRQVLPEGIIFDHVTDIHLSHSKLQETFIAELIAACPNVTTIKITEAYSAGPWILQNQACGSQPHLKALRVKGDLSHFSQHFLEYLLTLGANVESIAIENVQKNTDELLILENSFLPEPCRFEQLQSLIFKGKNRVSLDVILQMISTAPNLMQVELTQMDFTGCDLNYASLNKPTALRTLTVTQCRASNHFYYFLLNRCAQLQNFYMEDCTLLSSENNPFAYPSKKHKKLREVHIKQSVFCDRIFFYGIITAPNLESITLENIKYKEKMMKLGSFSMDRIKHIILKKLRVTTIMFQKLLTRFPALETIYLDECTLCGEGYTFPSQDRVVMVNLREFIIQSSMLFNLTSDNIPSELDCPNLGAIEIKNCSIRESTEEVLRASLKSNTRVNVKRHSYNSSYYNTDSNRNATMRLPRDSGRSGVMPHLASSMNRCASPASADSRRSDDASLSYHRMDRLPSTQNKDSFIVKPVTWGHRQSIVDQRIAHEPAITEELENTAQQYFLPTSIDPSRYRLFVGTQMTYGDGEIVLSEDKEKELISVDFKKSSIPLRKTYDDIYAKASSVYAYGELSIQLTREWQKLPSLSVEDKLISAYCDSDDYEIKYSKREDLYYIRGKNAALSNSNKKVNVNYIISYNLDQSCHDELGQDYPELNDLIAHCCQFTRGEFIVPKNASVDAILQARYDQQIGSCKKRSEVFFWKMQQLIKTDPRYQSFSVRYISNHCHDFVEIYNGKKWFSLNLGGYEATLKTEKLPEGEVAHKTTSLGSSAKLLPHNLAKEEDPIAFKNVQDKKTPKMMVSHDTNTVAIQDASAKKITEQDIHPELRTWEQPVELNSPIQLFRYTNKPGKKFLIKTAQEEDFLAIIAEFSANIKRPYYVIDNPSQLQWLMPGFELGKHNKLSIIKHATDLRTFLDRHPDGILFVNWSQFSATQLTALHSIVDTPGMLEEKELPAALTIIGFQAEQGKNVYNGVDFSSRNKVLTWNFKKPQCDLYHNRSTEQSVISAKNSCSLDLACSEDWESLLFGFIHIQHEQFTLEPSEFLKALADKAPELHELHLVNPPWHLREFQLFWQKALQRGEFTYYGKTFTLCEHFKLTYSMNLELKKQCIKSRSNEDSQLTFPLNTQTLDLFFKHYVYKEGGFESMPGILPQCRGQAVNLVVTESLSKPQWYRLLKEADLYGITLNLCTYDKSNTIHEELLDCPIEELSCTSTLLEENSDSVFAAAVSVLSSDNETIRDGVIQDLLVRYPEALYIELTKAHDFSDLFYEIHPSVQADTITAKFLPSQVWQALQNGETVIIHGTIPKSLESILSPLFLSGRNELFIEGQRVPFSGKLVFVTDTSIPFAYNNVMMNTSSHVEPSAVLVREKLPMQRYDNRDLSIQACNEYKNRRFSSIMKGFDESDIIFYSGVTGIGKTTYFIKNFEKDYYERTGRKAKLYIGKDNLMAFANHGDSEIDPFYLQDEVNLSPESLAMLQGLCSKHKKHLLYNQQYHDLSKKEIQYRAILLGNPDEYSEVREEEQFITKHAARVSAEIPNYAVLFHDILLPQLVLGEFDSREDLKDMAKYILDIYTQTNRIGIDKKDLLLSPRHLHMIAVLWVAYQQDFKDYPLTQKQLMMAACLTIIGDRLPTEKLAILKESFSFEEAAFQKAQTERVTKLLQKYPLPANFSFPASRYAALHLFTVFLSLSQQENFHFGLLLEGPSAAGKSSLVKTFLELLAIDCVQMSFTSNYEADRDKLVEYARQGKKIIIDEMNAGGACYEDLINTLIMGTDLQGVPFKEGKPIIFATQNDLGFSGRQPLSPAMKARFVLLNIAEYTEQELFEILSNLLKNEHLADAWHAQFLLARAYAKEHGLEPAPNLRVLVAAVTDPEIAASVDNYSEPSSKNCQAEILETPARKAPSFIEEFLSTVRSISSASSTRMVSPTASTSDPSSALPARVVPSIASTNSFFTSQKTTGPIVPVSPLKQKNQSYKIDQSLLNEINRHLTKLKKDMHLPFHRERRQQKKIVLESVYEQYAAGTLTIATIYSLEVANPALYDATFLSTVRDLLDRVKESITVSTSEALSM